MLKFVVGVVFGITAALGYVRWGSGSFEFLSLPEKLRGGVIVGAIESELYDLDKSEAVRQRALEVLFQNRADFAVKVDQETGHPFLKALYRRRVIREARQLRGQWSAFDVALDKQTLRNAMAKKYGVTETVALKQAMLWNAFQRKDFLMAWIAKNEGPVTAETLLPKLVALSRQP